MFLSFSLFLTRAVPIPARSNSEKRTKYQGNAFTQARFTSILVFTEKVEKWKSDSESIKQQSCETVINNSVAMILKSRVKIAKLV